MIKFIALLKSRRFMASIAGLATIALTHYGYEITEEQLTGVIVIISSFIIGDSLRKVE
jgi:hypothetical protein